ncbi:hypothetical protein GCM10010327_58390 [Streptomyces nitrosporeus]|nr:hypothetical protein GCM10010327_58390 [Streptomyces nitrosporeus]
MDAGTGRAVRSVPVEMFQKPGSVVSGGQDPGRGLGGVLAQVDRPAVTQSPVLVHEPVEQVRGHTGDFFECGADRLGDQLQAGQVTHRGQDVGGVGALRGPLAHQAGLLETDQREVEETVSTVTFSETVAEVGQHAVMEPGIVQFHRHGVLEVDATADRLSGLPVRQAEQELQHTDGGQLSRREPRPPIPRIPVGEDLVAPQPIEAVVYPYRHRTAGVARPRDLRGQRRDLLTGTGAKRQQAPRQLHQSAELPEYAH